jgi:hypothetical protein
VIDAAMALAGTDPITMPARRLLNVAQRLWLDTYPLESHRELRLHLAWPEDREKAEAREAAAQRRADEEEAQANLRGSAAVLGVNLDKAYERAVAARQAGLEELARRKRVAQQEAELREKSPQEWADEAAAAVGEA